MSLGEIVAKNVRKFRVERGLTQEELAHLAGVNRNYIGMIERQENSPTVETLEQIAGALKIEPGRLFQRR
jgi:transcriptional regulator with XRE-family HTH domain